MFACEVSIRDMTARVAAAVLILVFTTVAVGQNKPQQDKSPSLETTLDFMRNTLSRYGYIHVTGKDQEIALKRDELCRVYVDWEIRYAMHTPQDRVYPYEYQFHLGTIDPDSVKVTTSESQKDKPEGWKLTNVHLATTDNRPTIWASASEWKESKKVPKSLQMAEFTDFDFQFRDQEQAEKFSKALKHAVTLCGGKASAF